MNNAPEMNLEISDSLGGIELRMWWTTPDDMVLSFVYEIERARIRRANWPEGIVRGVIETMCESLRRDYAQQAGRQPIWDRDAFIKTSVERVLEAAR